jgi:hypothetical protein
MEEAAKLLGVSIDRLTEMRSNNEIFGYRDGPNWKFKISELERVAAEMGIALGGDNVLDEPAKTGSSFFMTESDKAMLVDEISGGLSDLELGDDRAKEKTDDSFSEMESVELMEDSSVDLFKPKSSEGSDIDFGLSDIHSEPESIELELADSGILKDKDKNKDKNKFRDKGEIVPSEENVFDDEDDLSFGSSSIRLASESSRKLLGAADDSVLDEGADKSKSPSDTGKMFGDELNLDDDDFHQDDLSLADDSMELSSDFNDSDLVLEDSDSSTEVKLEESGINLSASDSGILLKDDSQKSGSDIYSLELPEDDDDLIVVEGSSDDEFNLTPLADPLEEEESTGSQVIALEDSEIYADESSDAILGEEEFAAQPAMMDDGFGGGFDGGLGMGLAAAGMGGATVVPEAPYSIWQVLSLAGVALILLLGTMVGYGACQNMWMPDDQIVNRSVLNFFLNVAGLK